MFRGETSAHTCGGCRAAVRKSISWCHIRPHVRGMQSEAGCLIFDDTVEEKPSTDANELISTHFDHVGNRFVKGVNLLTALYHSGDTSLPVDFELILKTKWVEDPKTGGGSFQSEETKNSLMRRMRDFRLGRKLWIEDFVRKQVPFRYVEKTARGGFSVLADVWFACVENMVFIKQKKRKDFVSKKTARGGFSDPLKVNRRIALSEAEKQDKHFVSAVTAPLCAGSVSELPLPTACEGGTAVSPCQRIYLDKVPFALLLVASVVTDHEGKPSALYLVRSDLTQVFPQREHRLDAAAMLAVYKKRWKQAKRVSAGSRSFTSPSSPRNRRFSRATRRSPSRRPSGCGRRATISSPA